MTKQMNQAGRWLKRHWLDGAAFLLGLFLLVNLEVRSAWGAFMLAPQGVDLWATWWGEYPRAALQHATTSLGFGLMAFALWRIAAELKDDERPRIRSRAITARLAALACLCVPVGYLAQASGLERQLKAREAYIASDAYALDLRQAEYADEGSGDARERLSRAENPSSGRPTGGDWGFAIFAHLLVMVCAGIKTPAPISHFERKAMAAEALAKVEAEKRQERNRKARERRAEKRREAGGNVVFPSVFGQKR